MSKVKKAETEKNYFDELNSIDVSENIEKKGQLSYLSWSWAWTEIKKRYPNVKRVVNKNDDGWLYHTDGRTCWVDVSVVVNDIEEVEYLPIMDYRNQSIPLAKVTANNVNTAIQRATTKAIARHGLGLYIYAGEDLPKESAEPSLANIAEDVGNDMADLVEKEKQAKEARKGKAEEYFRKTKKDIEDCGSIEEIDALLERENSAVEKLKAGYKTIYNKLMDSVNEMKAIIDPDKEEVDTNLMGAG